MMSGLKTERSSKEPACVRINPDPIHMPDQTHLPESLTIPKLSVSPPKTSPLEVEQPKESTEMTCSRKPERSSQTGKASEQYSHPKPVDCPVTRSGRMS